VSSRDRLLRSFARRIDPTDAGAHNNLGVLYYNSGLREDAVAAFRRALELDPRLQVAQRNFEIAFVNCGHADARVAELRAHLRLHPNDRDARWEVARTCALLGDHAEAIAEFTRIVASHPDDLAALIQLGQSSRAIDAIDDARGYFERALEIDPHSSLIRFYLAEIAYNRGFNEAAVELLRAAIDRNQDNYEAWYLLGFVLGDEGLHEEAAQAAQRALALNPDFARSQANLAISDESVARYVDKAKRDAMTRQHLDVSADTQLTHLNLGIAFRRRGYLAEAMAEYELALQRGEDRDLVQQSMAELHLLRREMPQALALYDELIARQPESAKLWNERGVALHQSGRYAEAGECYEHAAALVPDYAVALNNAGVARAHCGDVEGAVQLLARSMATDPEFARARLNHALLLYKGRQLPQAVDAYRAVLARRPADDAAAVAWNGVGLVLSDLRQFDDARNAFARAIQLKPRFAEAHYNMSFALSSLGDFEGALRENKQALELTPYYTTQRLELALDLQFDDTALVVETDLAAERRVDESIDDFAFDPGVLDTLFTELASESLPATPVANPFAMASDFLSQGFFDRAQAEVLRAMSRGGDAVTGGVLLGDVFARKGLWGEALERYRDARRASPDNVPAMSGEARALLELGRAHDARAVAERVYERATNDVAALMLVAAAREASGELAGARAAFEKASDLAPTRRDVHKAIGDVARKLGDTGAAIAAYRDALALDGGFAAVRRELAHVYANRGDLEGAETELLAALDAVPSYSDAVVQLARVRNRRGRPADALAVLIELLERDVYHFDALMVLGETLVAMHQHDDARVAFTRVLRFDPHHVGARAAVNALAGARASSQAA
jgi:tetratricopeptide (TPR) repeat protein